MIVIGLTGLARSGKSQSANILINRLGFKHGRFANALKEMLRAFLRYRGCGEKLIERMLEGDLKEVSSPYLNGRTPRHAMQTLGTEWGRQHIHENIWVDTELDRHDTQHGGRIVFEDVRFVNEVEAIRRAGGKIIKIVRADAPAQGNHISEKLNVEPDFTVINNGSLFDLECKLIKLDIHRGSK